MNVIDFTADELAARIRALPGAELNGTLYRHSAEQHGQRLWVNNIAWMWIDDGRICVDDGDNVHALPNLGLAMTMVKRLEGY